MLRPQNVDPALYAGQLKIRVAELSEQDQELLLDIEVEVDRDVMNRRLSYLLIPELKSADSTVTGAGLLINGKIKSKIYRRKMAFANTNLLENLPQIKADVTNYADTLIRYTLRIPYQMWMDDAVLDIHQVLGSPTGKEQLYTLSGISRIRLQPREPYQVQPKINFLRIAKEVKDWNMQGLARLDFPVGQSVLRTDFRRNPEGLSKIDDILTAIIDDTDLTLTGIYLEGVASPEGSYTSNDQLSKARAEALMKYIKNKFSIPDRFFTIANTPEDWEGLKAMILRSDIPEKESILNIIENVGDFDQRERQIKALNRGIPYRRMLTEMFPELRRTEYRAEFNVREYTVQEAREVIRRKPQNLSLYEIIEVVEYYRNEGNEKELDYACEVMLRQYPDHPATLVNYAGYLLSRNETNGAKRYLDRLEDTPGSYNNLGVFYLLAGDLDTAEQYFLQASQKGVDEARYNLKETNKKRKNNLIMQRYNK